MNTRPDRIDRLTAQLAEALTEGTTPMPRIIREVWDEGTYNTSEAHIFNGITCEVEYSRTPRSGHSKYHEGHVRLRFADDDPLSFGLNGTGRGMDQTVTGPAEVEFSYRGEWEREALALAFEWLADQMRNG